MSRFRVVSRAISVSYHPSRDEWQAKAPAEHGMRPDGLRAAVDYHLAHESAWPRDLITPSGRYVRVADAPPPPGDATGPPRPRGGPNGLRPGVVRNRAGRAATAP